MILKVGDHIRLDNLDMEVDQVLPDGYWFKEIGKISYYLVYKTKKDAEELFKDGRIVIGQISKVESGNKECNWHSWRKYVGIHEIYEFCQNCGEKRFKDWRLIRDEKEY